MLRAIGEIYQSSPQPVRLCSLRYPLCNGAKLYKRGPPYCGEFGNGIFRWGATVRMDTLPALFAFIKAASSLIRPPTPYTNRGLHRLLTSGPHYCYVTRSCSPIALSIGLRLILMRAAQRSDCNSPTYCHHYITITPTCQVDYNVTTLYSLPSISSYRAGAAAALVM